MECPFGGRFSFLGRTYKFILMLREDMVLASFSGDGGVQNHDLQNG